VTRHAAAGNWVEAVKSMSPGIGNPIIAVQGERYDDRGRKKTVYESLFDRIEQAIGVIPANEAIKTDTRRVIEYAKKEQQEGSQKAIDAFLKAYQNGDERDMEKAREDLVKYRVTFDQLMRAKQQSQMTDLERSIRNTARKIRHETAGARAFLGDQLDED